VEEVEQLMLLEQQELVELVEEEMVH